MLSRPIITTIVIVLDNDTVKTVTEANIGSTVEKIVDKVSPKLNEDKKKVGLAAVGWSMVAVATWVAIAGIAVWPYLRGGE